MYIQSANVNGKLLDNVWLYHEVVTGGGKLVLQMGSKPNKSWGSSLKNAPPSMTIE